MPGNSPIEWGEFYQRQDPFRNFSDQFVNSFKEGLAFKLAQKEAKAKQMMEREIQKAKEQSQKFQDWTTYQNMQIRQQQQDRLAQEATEKAKARVNKQNMDLMGLEGKLKYQDAQIKLAGGRLSLAQQTLANQQNDAALNRLATDEWDSSVGAQVFNRILGASTSDELDAIEREESQLTDTVDWTTTDAYGGVRTVKKQNTDAGKVGLALEIRRRQLQGKKGGIQKPSPKAPSKKKFQILEVK